MNRIKIKQIFLMLVVALCTTVAFSQSTIKGKVIGSDMNAPLPGANVTEKGTSNGATTDSEGNFTLTTASASGTVTISYIGYTTQELSFTTNEDLGTISLSSGGVGLDEIQIIASVAVDRKTPVAVSTIKASEIELKLGTQEFPEILKSTPGVYATRAGGGFGDGRINLRGFNSENVAVLINGVPVNDMENGQVYWSNWAGLSDVTSSMQVQRGLGASKVAVPSVGGTINIISKTTDAEAGGNIYTTLGNDGYLKYGLTYSTGLMKNELAATVSASKTDGDGYVDGTEFNAASYFVNVSKKINDKHDLSFTAFGAIQRHGQRQNRQLISTYRASDRGIKFNADWGYKNGQVTHQEDNFYHKPQLSLNHYWDISDKTSLSTAVYASFGTGGGGGFSGTNKFGLGVNGVSDYRFGLYGPINFDKIVDENAENGTLGSETILRASRNDHNWYGVLSTLKTDLSDDFVLLTGVDYRNYKGIHYTELTDLLGGQYYADDSNANNPLGTYRVGDKISYYNDGLVGWLGGFGQLEYAKNNLAAFVSLAASNTSYKRVDYFNYVSTDPLKETDRYNFLGYSAKGGANYNIDENHNVFANLGYFEKAPDFDAVFPNFNNTDINDKAENQKISSFELGYGFRGSKFSANVNLYRTSWNDRTETASFQQPDGTRAYANILGVNAIHQGIEIDFVYNVTDELKITGMGSIGDWRWQNNVENIQILDEDQNLVQTVNLFIKDLHVADAAQTTYALGLNYKLTPTTNVAVDYNFYDKIFAEYNPSSRGTVKPDAWQMPSYGLFDLATNHRFKLGNFDAMLTARMNNVFNTEYVSDALDGSGSNAETALVWFGAGRTFSVGAKLNF